MGNRNMFVGLDVHKETMDVSTADGARQGEVRHYGVIASDLEPLDKARVRERVLATNLDEWTRRGGIAFDGRGDAGLRAVLEAPLNSVLMANDPEAS